MIPPPQFLYDVLWMLLTLIGFLYMLVLLQWFVGAYPFHRAFADESATPVKTLQIPAAVCPRCGFKSTEFLALAKRLKDEEGISEDDNH